MVDDLKFIYLFNGLTPDPPSTLIGNISVSGTSHQTSRAKIYEILFVAKVVVDRPFNGVECVLRLLTRTHYLSQLVPVRDKLIDKQRSEIKLDTRIVDYRK